MRSRPRAVGAAALTALLAGALASSPVQAGTGRTAAADAVGTVAAGAQAASGAGHDRLVSAIPAKTPAVVDGGVYAFAQVGDTMVVGGTFGAVISRGTTVQQSRPYVFAFDTTTGIVSSTFTPALNGEVDTLLPGPVPGTVYVGGEFTSLDGAGASHIVLVDVSTGQPVGGFRAAATNGGVKQVRLSDGRLFVAGTFTKAGGVGHGGLATLDPLTGGLDPFMDVMLAQHHNSSGTGAQAPVGARSFVITPDGWNMAVIGNFRTADGLARDQAVMVGLGGPSATVRADWRTRRYEAVCSPRAFDSYMRTVAMSPDGSFFVIGTTGGPHSGTLCDTVARFETGGTGDDVQPTWVDNSGGDTMWATAVTDEAVYVGGHQRWLNNANGSDSPGAGAVPRAGLAALDIRTGVPLAWNPGRNPRGEAVYVLYPTETGLWLGTNTNWIGDRKFRRLRIAYFPLAGGSPLAPDPAPVLPGTVYLAAKQDATDAVTGVPFDGSTRGTAATVASTGVAWRNARGAFWLDGTLYNGWADGSMTARSFDGTTFGTSRPLAPWADPAWATVATGSGQSYLGRASGLASELPSLTGMFYLDGRLYYTLSSSSSLYWRWFSPDSGVVGAIRFTAPAGYNFSTIRGMSYSGGFIYAASSSSGDLVRIAITDGSPASTSTPVAGASGVDWRARAMFLVGAPVNRAPTASFGSDCSGLGCGFDASASSDPDGTIASYGWDFGDSATATGATPAHTYAQDGLYDVTLTATDDDGSTDTVTHTVTVAASHIDAIGSAAVNANAAAVGVRIPSGAQTGDTAVLVATHNAVDPNVAAIAGWTVEGQQPAVSMATTVWTRVLTAGDPGSTLTVTADRALKTTLVVAVYRGVATDASGVQQTAAQDAATATHITPTTTSGAQAWELAYFADKSSATTAWTPPAGTTLRAAAYTAGGNRVTSLLVDSGGPLPAGILGARTATADAVSARGVTLTLVLALPPASGCAPLARC